MEIFGAMTFSAILTFTSIHLLIVTGFTDVMMAFGILLNVALLIGLLGRRTARPKMVARKLKRMLSEEKTV